MTERAPSGQQRRLGWTAPACFLAASTAHQPPDWSAGRRDHWARTRWRQSRRPCSACWAAVPNWSAGPPACRRWQARRKGWCRSPAGRHSADIQRLLPPSLLIARHRSLPQYQAHRWCCGTDRPPDSHRQDAPVAGPSKLRRQQGGWVRLHCLASWPTASTPARRIAGPVGAAGPPSVGWQRCCRHLRQQPWRRRPSVPLQRPRTWRRPGRRGRRRRGGRPAAPGWHPPPACCCAASCAAACCCQTGPRC
mmetsp:Transcript_8003/g.23650  ORF Transcript_8003/g.23650 Transcript_8003/m.23650 type:complete len:250 (+) Transcript_8003:620-1369(+)